MTVQSLSVPVVLRSPRPASLPRSGLVPLHNACSYGHYEVAELLVIHGAVVNVADLWKFTPLHEAAAKGKYEICKLLLQVRRPFGAGLLALSAEGLCDSRAWAWINTLLKALVCMGLTACPLYNGRYGSGGRAVVWQSEGCRFDPTPGVSECP